MSIGSTIKCLRREKDITQEQLAEYLGITSRAISQWECDRTAPDISQIPALCHIFDVSSDVLLGIDIDKTKEAIQNYLERSREAEYGGNFEKSVEILRDANRKFPRSYQIMHSLANALVCVHSRKGTKEYGEVFELCNKIIAECTESVTRYKAIHTLALAYEYAGKKDEMLKLAEEMPRAHFSYEDFMLYTWSGDEDFSKRQSYIYYLINQLISAVSCASGHRHDNGEFIYSSEERIELHKLEVKLIETMFPKGDYLYLAQYGEIACAHIVIALIRKNDIEGVWTWLEKAADFAIHMDTYDFDAPHTSLIMRGYVDGGWIMEAEGNRSQSMLNWLTTDDEAAVLHADERYEAIAERLKKVAKKPGADIID